MYEFTYTAFSIYIENGQNIEMKRSASARGHHQLQGWGGQENGYF